MKTLRFLRGAALQSARYARASLYALLSLGLGADECAVCGKPALFPVCGRCLNTLRAYEKRDARCQKCGRILISETGLCMRCRKEGGLSDISYCFPVFPYMLWMKELAVAWKVHGARILSPVFARIIADVLKNDMMISGLASADGQREAVVPVPPRPGKIRKRGWDQVEELCAWLELAHNIPVLRLLKRVAASEQKKLNKAGREQNARESYIFDERARKKIASGKITLPRAVILLDDVRTTGTTLETCAAVLKNEGVKEVRAVTLFGVE